MEKNEGILDRMIRGLVGFSLFIYSVINLDGTLQIISLLVSGVLIFTSVAGFCMIYKIFNISTIKKQK